LRGHAGTIQERRLRFERGGPKEQAHAQ
jgi:hypothetical protein